MRVLVWRDVVDLSASYPQPDCEMGLTHGLPLPARADRRAPKEEPPATATPNNTAVAACKPHSDRCTRYGSMSVQSRSKVVRRSISKWSRVGVCAYLERRIPGIPAFTILSRYVHHRKGAKTILHYKRLKFESIWEPGWFLAISMMYNLKRNTKALASVNVSFAISKSDLYHLNLHYKPFLHLAMSWSNIVMSSSTPDLKTFLI